jgi:hypothetical protein
LDEDKRGDAKEEGEDCQTEERDSFWLVRRSLQDR